MRGRQRNAAIAKKIRCAATSLPGNNTGAGLDRQNFLPASRRTGCWHGPARHSQTAGQGASRAPRHPQVLANHEGNGSFRSRRAPHFRILLAFHGLMLPHHAHPECHPSWSPISCCMPPGRWAGPNVLSSISAQCKAPLSPYFRDSRSPEFCAHGLAGLMAAHRSMESSGLVGQLCSPASQQRCPPGVYGQPVYLAALQRTHGWSARTIGRATTVSFIVGAGLLPWSAG